MLLRPHFKINTQKNKSQKSGRKSRTQSQKIRQPKYVRNFRIIGLLEVNWAKKLKLRDGE